MVQKLVSIILLISVARCAVLEETNDGLDPILQFDRKPAVIDLESVPGGEDIVDNLNALESKMLQRLDYIERKLDTLANSSCDKQNEEASPTNVTSQIAVTNQSKETEWDWSRCEEETVLHAQSIDSVHYHPLSVDGAQGKDAGAAGTRQRLGIRGDGAMHIYLSRKPRIDSTSGFFIEIAIGGTSGAWIASGMPHSLPINKAFKFSSSHYTRVELNIVGGLLELFVGDASTPLWHVWDPRLSQVQYIGFGTRTNNFNTTFKYGC